MTDWQGGSGWDDFEGAVVALSGGVGGAKLILGLNDVLAPGKLIVVANTGDDFEHLGLQISPDLDTIMYTLAGLNNEELGWGVRGETWNFMNSLTRLGGETWFRLGDSDLATHVERTRRSRLGDSLSSITQGLCARLGVTAELLPMTDDCVRTKIKTHDGWIDFQDYFVRLRCQPIVEKVAFEGIEVARPLPRFLDALRHPGLRAIVICPSNPFISVEPILGLSGVRAAIAASRAPVVAVSPIIGGMAIKGPTAKMMVELGLAPTPDSVADRYQDIIDGFVVDPKDNVDQGDRKYRLLKFPALMKDRTDKKRLASEVLEFANKIRKYSK